MQSSTEPEFDSKKQARFEAREATYTDDASATALRSLVLHPFGRGCVLAFPSEGQETIDQETRSYCKSHPTNVP